MVSFSCNYCNDVVTKPKIQNHARSCGSDSFSCVDCMKVFDLETIKPHTTCVSEVAKYQGKYQSLANGNPVKRQRAADSSDDEQQPAKGTQKPKRVVPTFSDSDDEDWVASKPKKVHAPKKSESPKHRPSTPPISPTHAPKKAVDVNILCTVPEFLLGTAGEVCEIVKNIVEERGTHMTSKDVSKQLVLRYQARLAKHLKPVLDKAVQHAGAAHGVTEHDGVIRL